MKVIYRVLIAVDFKGQRERNLYYTENREDAENQFIEAQKKIKRFGEEKGLKVTDIKHSENFMTTFANGNQKGKPFTGARAEFSSDDCQKDNFLDMSNDPIF